MSNIYIQEPPALGKVLLKTSAGDIDIELWTKEAPKACRNFIQLCMEGYYKGTIFHRVVPGFIVQGGDPNGDGTGGESVYGGTFKDEFHQRLRFNRRGLVAMANAGKDDNGSQFFFTLAATPELQNKHTIFGKVTGDTIYNVLKLAEGLIGPDDRPEHPRKITGADVVINPFEDIVPRVRVGREPRGDERKAKREGKAVKNFGLLSFGEEAEEDEGEATEFRGKPKSTHDLLDDPKLSKLTAADLEEQEKVIAERGPTQAEIDSKLLETAAAVGSIRDKLKTKQRDKSPPTSAKRRKETDSKSGPSVPGRKERDSESGPSGPGRKERDVKSENEKKGKRMEDTSDQSDKDSDSGGEEYYLGKERDDEIKKDRERIKGEFLKLKKEMKGARDKANKPEETIDSGSSTDKQNDNEMYTQFVEEQEKYKKLKEKIPKKGAAREDFTLQLLAKFKSKLSAIKEKSQAESDIPAVAATAVADDDVNNEEWLGHTLCFEDKQPVLAKDASSKTDDWFDIYDPRNPINKRKRERSEKTKKK